MEQPDEDRNSSPSTEMEEMIARFQLVLPTAPDVCLLVHFLIGSGSRDNYQPSWGWQILAK